MPKAIYSVFKGRGMTNKKHSPESKEKMRLSSLGQKAWNKGKKMSDEMREKCRQNKIGNKNRLGKKHSLETRIKISQNRSNKLTGPKHPRWAGGAKESLLRANKIRKVRLSFSNGSHTIYEWELLKQQYNHTCPACKEIKSLTKDHIIPLAKGGSNNIENIQPLCKRCNSKKHIKIVKY